MPNIVVTFRMQSEELEKLDKIRTPLERNRSQQIRFILKQYIKTYLKVDSQDDEIIFQKDGTLLKKVKK